ncbi:RNA polymerase-binding protein DksA [Megalodesulfovibrio gigas]|uniref:Putative TraR/DksA family transcriptional regulator n=1 Tax=Megalodesulfovibrio gigas (strain ATCC 19364 / DSM 1382 / NCIMB 9332 / VKM B-1759) TaxID=1121448 RepID=T2GEL2_MEGG1|nr:RNA polymerase-binding protein DksA [Megalodesulfovibrio gigas]AGW14723.1 putative TraR/DksA family transcriptional regulator [Megalodesulfovibrio gigas DSM 1382 = ATCC 19364]
MDHEQMEFFKTLLKGMANEILQRGDDTVASMQGGDMDMPDPADRASAESEREFLLSLRQREHTMLRKIREALQRIEDGEYGECEECGEAIGVARLKARPVTTLCIHCKQRQEQLEAVPGTGSGPQPQQYEF